MEIKNAVIESASLQLDRGCLSMWLHLDYGGTGQGFGGYALQLAESFTHWDKNGPAGYYIMKCFEVAGVENIKDLKGKTIRVKGSHSKIESIGHIIKDIWFTPSKDLKETP